MEETLKEEKEEEVCDVVLKVEINIRLTDVIKQSPDYALRGDEKLMIDQYVSTVLQRNLPPKYKKPNEQVKVVEVAIDEHRKRRRLLVNTSSKLGVAQEEEAMVVQSLRPIPKPHWNTN